MMSLIKTWTPSFIHDLQCQSDWVFKAQIHIVPVHVTSYVFVCKGGSKGDSPLYLKANCKRSWAKFILLYSKWCKGCILSCNDGLLYKKSLAPHLKMIKQSKVRGVFHHIMERDSYKYLFPNSFQNQKILSKGKFRQPRKALCACILILW